jgi:hypothetical protein
LSELEEPERIIQIVKDFERRKAREKAKRPVNPLRPAEPIIDIDDLYGEDEGGGACTICHK